MRGAAAAVRAASEQPMCVGAELLVRHALPRPHLRHHRDLQGDSKGIYVNAVDNFFPSSENCLEDPVRESGGELN